MPETRCDKVTDLIKGGFLPPDGNHAIVMRALGEEGLDLLSSIMLGKTTYGDHTTRGDAARAFIRDCKSAIKEA